MVKVYRTDELEHHGVKGMKWGVRRYQNVDGTLTEAGRHRYSTRTAGSKAPSHLSDIPKSTLKTAQKDAKETAEAKMFYGEGAGTRRKLIKNTVEERSKDPAYKKAYDYYLENQDMAKAAEKARIKRTAIDTREQTLKTAKKVTKVVAAITTTAASIYYSMHKAEVDKFILSQMDKLIKFS